MTDWESDPMLEAKIRQARIKNQQRLAAMTQAERDTINATMRKSPYDKFVEAEEQIEDDARAIAAMIAFDRQGKQLPRLLRLESRQP